MKKINLNECEFALLVKLKTGVHQVLLDKEVLVNFLSSLEELKVYEPIIEGIELTTRENFINRRDIN